jgi:transcriptional regulator with XRE-family HTH domain
MRLGEKIRYLRQVEGSLRGLGRELTQLEVVRGIQKELRANLSQSYLSQIESGARPHLTNATRMLLAAFFKVHPGYLVDDPEGYHAELSSPLREAEQSLDLWLMQGAERFRKDPEISRALQEVAKQDNSRKWVLLMGALMHEPRTAEELYQILVAPRKGKPKRSAARAVKSGRRGK